jgi:hypothetical protein
MKDNFLLDERVGAMPIHAMEAVLRSEHLELKTENTTFTLALYWVKKQPGTEEERQRLFNRLLKSPRCATPA